MKIKTLTFSLLCLFSASSNAGIIYDNGGVSIGDPGNETTRWVQADNFNIADGGLVKGAGVYIGATRGNLSAWDGTLEYFLFADAGPKPGALITSGNGVNVTTSDTGIEWCCSGNAWLFEFDFESRFAAAPDTDYWLGIHLSRDYGRDGLFWIAQVGSPGEQSESLGGTFNNWTIDNVERAFYLTDDSVPTSSDVPEPSVAFLLSIGFLGMSLFRRKKAN
jgi:hypothetical protein